MAGFGSSLQESLATQAMSMSSAEARSLEMEEQLRALVESTPGSYTYQHLLSRIGAREQDIHERTNSDSSINQQKYGRIPTLLLAQPVEIKTLILSFFAAPDLLALRAVNRDIHNLVHNSATALSAAWADRINKQYNLNRTPILLPDIAQFIRVSQQYASVHGVSDIIAERISRYLRLSSNRLDKEALEAWRKRKQTRLCTRLTRALLLLQYYLNFLLDTFNDNEGYLSCLDNDEYMTLHNIFDLDQQAWLNSTMKHLSERDFIDVTAALSIFKATCKARGVDFRYKPPTAHSSISVRQLFVYKGFKPFVELLSRHTNFTQQSVALQRSILKIARDRFRYPSWVPPRVEGIHAVEEYHRNAAVAFDTGRSQHARDTFVAHQDIWDRAARALMMPALGRFPNIQSSTTWIQKVCVVYSEERESEIVVGAWDAIDVPTI